MLTVRCFENNYLKWGTYKCHLIISVFKQEQVWENIRKDLISERNDVKLLGIITDRDLKHVLKLCCKTNQKVSTVFSLFSDPF